MTIPSSVLFMFKFRSYIFEHFVSYGLCWWDWEFFLLQFFSNILNLLRVFRVSLKVIVSSVLCLNWNQWFDLSWYFCFGDSCLFGVFFLSEVSIERGIFIQDLEGFCLGDSWVTCDGFPSWKEDGCTICSFWVSFSVKIGFEEKACLVCGMEACRKVGVLFSFRFKGFSIRRLHF